MRRLYRIAWNLGTTTGRGLPMDKTDASEWVKKLDAKYGLGTHWLEEVVDDVPAQEGQRVP